MGMNLGPSGHKGHRLYKPMSEMKHHADGRRHAGTDDHLYGRRPMMTQGVQVALPKADAKPIEQDKPVRNHC